ncbi:GNAT family N-acetyltransferase [Paraflavitalea sp. CAU 1676]|uniref:GNAT family N-acetyltransferase n=1 Tax=Paraflavitalea sp. CAU 1676 TaxID=3032598 RepID=UPI0023D9EFAE|nr:GNAT family N-acetyltransferase [Paraflavitalea sp. CAU 1676]MDF2188035.1 GNAT family N-acetyltransferase [Paraflavitalea sp. CAU 1676]
MPYLVQIKKATKTDHPILIDIWEASVRATHHFLTNEDILYFRERILELYFDLVDLYYLHLQEYDSVAGLLGIHEGKVEMLFIDPKYFGRGYGRLLMEFAIDEHQVTKVDVNEHNPDALQFYEKLGFSVVNRLEKDSEGKDFPILQLELREK